MQRGSCGPGVDDEPGQFVWGCVLVYGSPRDILERRTDDFDVESAGVACAHVFGGGSIAGSKRLTYPGRETCRSQVVDVVTDEVDVRVSGRAELMHLLGEVGDVKLLPCHLLDELEPGCIVGVDGDSGAAGSYFDALNAMTRAFVIASPSSTGRS